MKQILIAHDGSKPSDRALERAVAMAEKFGASVTVISVIPELYLTELAETDRSRILESLKEKAERLMARIRQRPGRKAHIGTIIKQGRPSEEVLKAARKIKADLIITGSHGRHGAEKLLLGSVSSKIADSADCDVYIVK